MEAILLSYRGEPLRLFPVRDRSLEVGSGAQCDVVVHDALIAERHCLVRRDDDGLLEVIFLDSDAPPIRLAGDMEIPIGTRHSIARAPELEHEELEQRTEPISIVSDEADLEIVVGRSSEARRMRLRGRPVTVGCGPGADLVLFDRTVSTTHCRFETTPAGTWLRDLGSRNGTFVDGVRMNLGRIGPGSRIRVGRTEIFVVEQGRKGDVRSHGIVAASPQMIEILGQIERFAKLAAPVLVTGPSGAGKEGLARALHTRSQRAQGPFVAINAAAIPRDLVEAELFGYEKGAFTGAAQTRRGVFEQATGGTLFLDEIGELAVGVQARLLRVLENWEVRRIGSESAVKLDVRLVCATHRDLRALVAKGMFRADLYYRLVQLKVEVPPLADRPEDVRALALHFLEQEAQQNGRGSISSDAIEALLAYRWPGNARELRNVIVSAASESAGVIQRADVVRALKSIAGTDALTDVSFHGASALVERHGSVAAAARALGVARTTLRDRLKRSDHVPDGRTREARMRVAQEE
jgi:transcriptional regulator with AAA-type ATPase domain